MNTSQRYLRFDDRHDRKESFSKTEDALPAISTRLTTGKRVCEFMAATQMPPDWSIPAAAIEQETHHTIQREVAVDQWKQNGQSNTCGLEATGVQCCSRKQYGSGRGGVGGADSTMSATDDRLCLFLVSQAFVHISHPIRPLIHAGQPTPGETLPDLTQTPNLTSASESPSAPPLTRDELFYPIQSKDPNCRLAVTSPNGKHSNSQSEIQVAEHPARILYLIGTALSTTSHRQAQ
ncbi:hypothetical protein DL546_008575 [Coniochaeta pulveracea]|uniref:Uncharacterized protein n=1 Tax=Coniochaeta pulveracea TaxID=177199 RepID=A0A420YEI2_9PEZI|nr:hypothetical protein DL546_008575 [Coniochaeta pulveracea]